MEQELVCRSCKREWDSSSGLHCKGCGGVGEPIIVTVSMELKEHA